MVVDKVGHHAEWLFISFSLIGLFLFYGLEKGLEYRDYLLTIFSWVMSIALFIASLFLLIMVVESYTYVAVCSDIFVLCVYGYLGLHAWPSAFSDVTEWS
jgi:hypothetical protein